MSLKKILKIVISLSFIGVIVYRADWVEIKSIFLSLGIVPIIFVMLLKLIQYPINTQKWRLCLNMHELDYSFKFLLKASCIGYFFNNLFPSTIGGDGYRVIKTTPKDGVKSRALSAILLERLIGVLSLLFIGWFGVAVIAAKHNSYVINIYFIGGLIGITFFAVMCYLVRIDSFRHHIEEFLLARKWGPIIRNLRYIKKNRNKIIPVFFYSVLFHIVAIGNISLIFMAAGANIAFTESAVIASLSQIVAILPISINGLGIAEGAFVYMASQIGIKYGVAVIVAFMVRALTIPFSAACGIMYAFDNKN